MRWLTARPDIKPVFFVHDLLPVEAPEFFRAREAMLHPRRMGNVCRYGAGAVVVGMDRDLNWRKLVEAGLAIAAGAAFIGTNPDRTFPTERGLGPGNGAILAALETATRRPPVIVGKPEPPLFLEATSRLAVPPAETLVVGDRLETDIVGGARVRMQTALLLTGVTSAADLSGYEIQPDWIFEDLPALLQRLPEWVR